jgi:curved DNA-binding protein
MGSNWKAGQDFQPPPNWDAGFEFRGGQGGPFGAAARSAAPRASTRAISSSRCSVAAARRPRAGPRRRGNVQGEDHHAKV